jgi:CARDB protein
MTRRVARPAALAALAAAAALAALPAAASARGDLVAAAASEAPDRQDPGGSWPQAVTVLNQGTTAAARSVTRAYLSSDAAFDAADKALDGSGNVGRLRARRQTSQTFQLTVPAGTPNGSYYVLVCVDDAKAVTEVNEDNNCRPSGQRLGVGASERGPIGAPGPQGPPGAAGADAVGPNTGFRPIARTVLPLGSATVDLATFPRANGDRPDGTATPDEGSTSETSLVKYGPFDIVASCKRVTNGDDDTPSTPPIDGSTEFGPNGWDEDGDEAKVLVYVNEGSYTMAGRVGPRKDIPAGRGTPADDGVNGGEGKHMALAVNHDPGETEEDQGPPEDNQQAWTHVYRTTDTYIVHSSGTQLILRAWAGIDVLGVGDDNCVFGGVLEVVQP